MRHPEPERAQIEPLLARHLEEAQRIGRDGGQHRGPEIAHELQLQGRAAGADRHHHRPDPLGPVVKAEAAGEEAE